MDWYLLDDNHNVIGPTEDIAAAHENKTKHHRVALTKVYDGCEVSTVFLGLNHAWGDRDPPLLFESMVFGGPFSDDQERYATWAEAEAGHARLVEKCQPIMTEDA
jgi:hypothetical protein